MAVPTDIQENLVQQIKPIGSVSPEDQQILDELQIFTCDSENIRRYPALAKLLQRETDKICKGIKCSEEKFIDLESGKTTRMTFKVLLPVEKYPQFNYVGRILGPKGATLRGMQEISGCKMAVLGKGSMRDKVKEEKCRQEGGKFAHLNEPLQIWMQACGTPDDIFYKLHIACKEVKKYLQADYNDDIFTEQMALLEQMGGCHPKAIAFSEENNQTHLQSSASATTRKGMRGVLRGIHSHRGGYSASDQSRFVLAGNIGRRRPLEHAMRGALQGNRGRGRGIGQNHGPRSASATAIGMQQSQPVNQRMDCENYYEEMYDQMYENFTGISPYQNGIENA